MGEIAETMTKKKKKGRQSLLDLQKRAIKQQQLQQKHHHHNDDDDDHRSSAKKPNSLNSGVRSKRRNYNLNGVSSDSPLINDDNDCDEIEDDDGDDERREKKHRLLHGLNSTSHRHSPNSRFGGSDLNLDEPSIGGGGGSNYTVEKASKVTDILQGSSLECGGPTTTTPLPDKKLLVFILDRLQKKDTYGVYSDPVDPEELPDYHEIITNPMDFSTLRKKLNSGAYATLEQFESDVFLICTNAMEYNSADTVYYRQARAIQELAKKDFENLRQDSDDEEPRNQQQPKVPRRGRPPKKQPEPSLFDHTASEISADALIPGGGGGAYNLRKTPPSYRFRQAEASVRINHNSETQSCWPVDWENEFPPSVVKAVNKYGMKHFNVDENRRDTYNHHLSTSTQEESSVLTMLEDESKQLIPVGLNTEHGYARSLARYAANLGPVPWKLASRRIETVLPSGVKYGLGWVGENPVVPDEDNASRKQNLLMSSGEQKCCYDLASDDHSNRIDETASVPARVSNPEASEPLIHRDSSNGLIHGTSHNPSQRVVQGQGVLFPCNKQESQRSPPPDLNDKLVSPNYPRSNPQTDSSSSLQPPDLALQL